jgi:hypothetical protein
MSVAGISSSSLFNYSPQNVQNQSPMQLFRQEFQQLGQDLQSGNLSAAQSDFATLEKSAPQGSSASAPSSGAIFQGFQQLSTDLQSGNVSAAQQDYSNIQKDFQNIAAQHHHHHHLGGGGGGSSSESQSIDQLGQALQSGNLSAAQQAYSSLLQEFQQFGENSALLTSQNLLAQSPAKISVSA